MHKERIGQTQFTFRFAESPDVLDEIYRLRYQVYCNECGFIKASDYPDKIERDKFDPYSLHFVAEDRTGLIGTARLILHNPYAFPLEKHCAGDLTLDLEKSGRENFAEISRLVISKAYRRRRDDGLYYSQDYSGKPDENKEMIQRIKPMAFGLYREIYQECKRRNITHWLALMEKTLWLLLRMHNFVFMDIGKEVDVYGPVKPYVCAIKDTEEAVAKRSPQFLNYFLDGLERQYQPQLSLNK